MSFTRSLFIVGLTSVVLAAGGASAGPFDWLPDASPTVEAPDYLPPDADPYYSTRGGFDRDVDMTLSTRKTVEDPTGEAAGTLTVNTKLR
ncbi:MAG: hypothetical protein JO107_06755, partial [Hyphomicrobiales bacterium]|nr:hypothetical protein [Hyphomicrobiales bacterium]MBV8662786.1 hypothetical protein [Hyphomicrobiales bacterium]